MKDFIKIAIHSIIFNDEKNFPFLNLSLDEEFGNDEIEIKNTTKKHTEDE